MMFRERAFFKFAVFLTLILTVNCLCDNVKTVCDCDQTNITRIYCPKKSDGGQYTHHLEIKTLNNYVQVDCLSFNGLNKIPKLNLDRLHVETIVFKNCFNNDTSHTNYNFELVPFISTTLNAYDDVWKSINVSFHDLGKVNEPLFFDHWPLFNSDVVIKNINTETSKYVAHLYNVSHLTLVNTNLVDFNVFYGRTEMIKHLIIIDTKSILNFNELNLAKFRNLLSLTVERSNIDNDQVFKQGPLFERNSKVQEITLRSIFNDYTTNKTELNAKIFHNLNQLKTLNLIDLKLEELPPTIFDELRQMSKIALRHNLLSRLDINLFVKCSNLSEIDLSHNNFVRFESAIFLELSKLTKLNLAHNHLQAFLFDAKYHNGFKELYLQHNHIQMESFTCPIINMQHSSGIIDYSYNQIIRSEPILDCLKKNKLRNLIVNHNQIRSLKLFNLLAQNQSRDYVTLDFNNNMIDYVDALESPKKIIEYKTVNLQGKVQIVLRLDSNPIFCENCLYGRSIFPDGVILEYHDHVIQIVETEFCRKTLFCPMTYLHTKYECPASCHCTYNNRCNCLAINCESALLTDIPYISDEDLHEITVNEIHLYLQDNRISNISFDKLMHNKTTSFEVIRRITIINLERNSIKTLKIEQDDFPINLKILKLASNRISSIDDTTLVMLNKRESLLSVALGNNTITNDHQLYSQYIDRIKFTISDRKAIDANLNKTKLDAHILNQPDSKVSIMVVSFIFILIAIGLSYIGYVFHRNHSKVVTEQNIQQTQAELVPTTEPSIETL